MLDKIFKLIVIIGIVLIIAGLKYGDIGGLLIKSKNICYECIGVG